MPCAAHIQQVLFKVFSGHKPPVPPDMPAQYRGLMERCWAHEPQDRPTFKEVKVALRDMLGQQGDVAPRPVPFVLGRAADDA